MDQLARLGVISKVSTLAGPSSDDENEEESKPEKVCRVASTFVRWLAVLEILCECILNVYYTLIWRVLGPI